MAKVKPITESTRFHLFEYVDGRALHASTHIAPAALAKARYHKEWLKRFNRGVDKKVVRKIGRPHERNRTYEIVRCDVRENCTPCWDYDNHELRKPTNA